MIRYGASAFQSGWQEGIAVVGFVMRDRRIRFTLPLPHRDDKKFAVTPVRGELRSQDARLEAWEQACRQKWRALCLAIKAKLEAVECGIAQFEQEFLAYIVDPHTGQTVGDVVVPQIAQSYLGVETKAIALLPAPTSTGK